MLCRSPSPERPWCRLACRWPLGRQSPHCDVGLGVTGRGLPPRCFLSLPRQSHVPGAGPSHACPLATWTPRGPRPLHRKGRPRVGGCGLALGPCPQTSRSGNPGRRAGPRSLRFCDSFLELFINIRVVGGVLSVSREGTRGRASVWGSGDRCFCPAQNHFPISGVHAGSICTRPGWSTDGNRKGLGVRCTGAAPGEGLGSHGPGRSPCWVPQQAPLPPLPE